MLESQLVAVDFTGTVDPTDPASVTRLLTHCLALLPADTRTSASPPLQILAETPDSGPWQAAAVDVGRAVDPLLPGGSGVAEVLACVVGRAVEAVYSDDWPLYNKEAAEAQERRRLRHAITRLDEATDYGSDEFGAAVRLLAGALGLPDPVDVASAGVDPTGPVKVLRAAMRQCRLSAEQRREGSTEVTPKNRAEALSAMPLGFSTGDAAVDSVAKSLRLLHVAELRELQQKINAVMGAVQEHTADPVTNTRLGRVGR